MPIVEDQSVKTLASTQDGAITTILIRDTGSNLPPSTVLYAGVVGNGTGGRVRISTTAQGTIADAYLCDVGGQRVNITGSGFKYASIPLKQNYLYTNPSLATFATISSSATGWIEPIISFQGGHGSDPVLELSAKRVMANIRLTYAEGSGDFPVDNDFRRIGILVNPKLPAPSTEFATVDTLNGLYALKLENVTTAFVPDEVVSQEVQSGKVHSWTG
jgi:hypothetical protein